MIHPAIQERLQSLEQRLKEMLSCLDIAQKKKKLASLQESQTASDFWQEAEKAKNVIDCAKELKSWVDPLVDLEQRLEALQEIFPEACSLAEEALLQELLEELTLLEKILEELELRHMLSGPYDNTSCYLSIHSGAGGTEACDWVDLLARMYERWATGRGWQVEMVDRLEGDVAGSKNCTLRLTGPFAYGYAKAEQGVHRLVRISPFDTNQRRHTSFASVEVLPDIPEQLEIVIKADDLRIETYRASGAGGQHVNKTDSAVRITHLPSRIVVSCQNERSQLQNKETCRKMLRAKLFAIEQKKHREKLAALCGEKMQNSWGSQIRNYVFQPYTLAKDARTGIEVGDVMAVMNGALDPFIYAYLKKFGGQDG